MKIEIEVACQCGELLNVKEETQAAKTLYLTVAPCSHCSKEEAQETERKPVVHPLFKEVLKGLMP